MKKTYVTLLALFSLLIGSARAAEQIGSVDAFINGLVQISHVKCAENPGALADDYRKKGDLLTAYQVAQADKAICQCIPGRLKALQTRLSKAERAKKVSESAFATQYFMSERNVCLGEQLQSTFAGACAERYAKLVPDGAKFCSCMSDITAGLSGAQAAQIGNEMADYLSLAAAAKETGKPPPAPTPILKSFMDTQQSCAQP